MQRAQALDQLEHDVFGQMPDPGWVEGRDQRASVGDGRHHSIASPVGALGDGRLVDHLPGAQPVAVGRDFPAQLHQPRHGTGRWLRGGGECALGIRQRDAGVVAFLGDLRQLGDQLGFGQVAAGHD